MELKKVKVEILRPFGSSIAKVRIPEETYI